MPRLASLRANARDERKVLRGFMSKLPAPGLVEIGAHAGFDFVVIDLEHSPIGVAETEHMLRAAEAAALPAVVRVPSYDSPLLAQVADMGASGVAAPMMRSAEEVAAFVRRLQYPPTGTRGASPTGRAVAYGTRPRSTSSEVDAWVLLESSEAVEAIGEIAAVPGVGVVWVGLQDLALDVGVDGPNASQIAPAIEDAIDRITEACVANGVDVALAGRIPNLDRWVARGIRVFYLGPDVSLFLEGCREAIADFDRKNMGMIGPDGGSDA